MNTKLRKSEPSSVSACYTIFLHETSSWFEIRLHTENQLPGYPGSGLKVSVVVGGGVYG